MTPFQLETYLVQKIAEIPKTDSLDGAILLIQRRPDTNTALGGVVSVGQTDTIPLLLNTLHYILMGCFNIDLRNEIRTLSDSIDSACSRIDQTNSDFIARIMEKIDDGNPNGSYPKGGKPEGDHPGAHAGGGHIGTGPNASGLNAGGTNTGTLHARAVPERGASRELSDFIEEMEDINRREEQERRRRLQLAKKPR